MTGCRCSASSHRLVDSTSTPARCSARSSFGCESRLAAGSPSAARTRSAAAASFAGGPPAGGRSPSVSTRMRSCAAASHGRPAARSSSAMSAPADSAAVSRRSRPGSADAAIARALPRELVQRGREPAGGPPRVAAASSIPVEERGSLRRPARRRMRHPTPPRRAALRSRSRAPTRAGSRGTGAGRGSARPGRRRRAARRTRPVRRSRPSAAPRRPRSRPPTPRTPDVVRVSRRQLGAVAIEQRGRDPVVRPAEDDPGRAASSRDQT